MNKKIKISLLGVLLTSSLFPKNTKKKEESIRQLDRAQNNFNRVSDLTKELARDYAISF